MTSTRSPESPGALPWSRTTEVVAVVGFWVFLAALEVLRRTADPFRPPGGASAGAEALAHAAVYAVWAVLTPFVFWLTRRFPLRGPVAWRVLLHVGIALLVAVVVEFINFNAVRAATGPPPPRPEMGPPPGAPRPAFGVAGLVLRLWFLDEFVLYLGVLAVGFARSAFADLREREREAAALQEEGVTLKAERATLRAEQATLKAERAGLQAQLADARLSALRMQLNPHFLFNTLHAISSLADDDPAGVQRVVARLSALLRRALEGTARQEVPLAEELSFLHDYLEIQRVRFGGALRVHERVDPAVRDALVPTLVLQPLVENAVEHGVGPAGKGTITLSARLDGEALVLGVQDDGPGLGASNGAASAKGRGGIGLQNTRARLAALYGEDGRLDLVEPEAGGLLVALTLPYHTADDLRAAAPA